MFNTRRHNNSARLLAFLAKAPIERVVPHSRISHFSSESVICSGEHLVDCAYLVLEGACEQRAAHSAGETGLIRTFKRGEAFGLLPERTTPDADSVIVAAEDTVVLGIRLEDLAALAGRARTPASDESPRAAERSAGNLFYKPPRGKLFTLMFISPALPRQFLTQSIARRLHAETGDPVLQVQLDLAPPAAQGRLEPVGGAPTKTFPVNGAIPQVEPGVHSLRLAITADSVDPRVLGPWFQRLRGHFSHVLVSVCARQIPRPHLLACVTQSNAAYLFLRQAASDLYHLDLLLHDLAPRLNGHLMTDIKPVLCLGSRESVNGFDARIRRIGIPACSFLHECPVQSWDNESVSSGALPESFQAGIRRLARDMSDRLIGLALASGGAKGFAHIGVIQVLEEQGIEVDVVAGASMGAYVGSLWAYGCNADQLVELAREMKGRWALWSVIDPVFPPRQGFLRGLAVKRRLQRTIGHARFCDLQRPLHVVATNLATLERKVFSHGEVATAVHASLAVPGICVPVRIGGEAYVDGGIVDPLPADVLHELGVHRILAVNTIHVSDHLRLQLEARRQPARRRLPVVELKRPLDPIAQRLNYFAPGNILDILMHSIHGAQIRMAEASGWKATLVLRPDVQESRWLDFRNADQHIEAGRKAALEHLAEIKLLKQTKGVIYEKPSPVPSMATVARP